MNAKLILQAAITGQQIQPQHATRRGVPEDFIFASNYTWLGRN